MVRHGTLRCYSPRRDRGLKPIIWKRREIRGTWWNSMTDSSTYSPCLLLNTNGLLAFSEVVIAPAKVRLRSGRFREPDLLVRLSRSEGDTSDYAVHVDIAIEVVSPSWAEHDMVVKRREYAEAGIPEYWIVDPSTSVITVLKLAGSGYETVGEFGVGTRMTSVVLAGLSVDVGEVFAAAKPS
jgi:Uma2 family endonuclease